MSNQVVQFSMSDLQQRARDSIRSNIGMLMPQEIFDQLVDKTVKEFFEQTGEFEIREKSFIINPEASTWNQRTGTRKYLSTPLSPFQAIIWEELVLLAREALKQYLDKEQTELNKRFIGILLSQPKFTDSMTGSLAAIAQYMQNVQAADTVKSAMGVFRDSICKAMEMNNDYTTANQIRQELSDRGI